MAYQDPNSDAGIGVALGTSALGTAAQQGINYANAAIQYFNQKRFNRQAQHMIQENMLLQKKLNLEQQYQSIANSTSAYKAAGLNPALAVGAPAAAGVSMAPGNAGSAAMPASADVSAMISAGAQLDLLSAQKENLLAGAEKARAEAHESESRIPTYAQNIKESESRIPTYAQNIKESESRIDWNNASVKQLEQQVKNLSYDELLLSTQYRREIDKDSLAGKFVTDEFKARVESAQTQYEKDFWNGLLEEAADGTMTVGALEALRSWVAYNDEAGAMENNELARQVQAKVMGLQLNDNDVLYSLAHMAPAAYRQTLASALDLIESAKFRKVAREIQLPSESAFLEQQSTTMKNNDFIGHINNGEYGQAALTQVPALLHLAEEGAFLYLLRGRAAADAGSAPLPYSSMNPRDVQKALELSRNEIKALKQAKKSAETNKRLGELYRDEKALMERLREFNATDYSR